VSEIFALQEAPKLYSNKGLSLAEINGNHRSVELDPDEFHSILTSDLLSDRDYKFG
jgi:hypothetical protein